MDRAVVYGMSTEGYTLASRMCRYAETYIIDEINNLAILLKPEMANMYASVTILMEDEPLMSVISLREAISHARYVFFAPRIRQSGVNANVQIQAGIRDVARHMKPDSSFICNLPMGLDGNAQYISLLRHVTGTDHNGMNYYYYPLEGISQQDVIGSLYKTNTDISTILPGDNKNFVSIHAAERIHALRVLSKFSSLLGILEVCRYATDKDDMAVDPRNDTFIDDMIDGLYDMYQINHSHASVYTLQFLTNNITKSINKFLKRLTDKVRTTVRQNGMSMVNTNILVAWSIDQHSMRGDKIETRNTLLGMIQNYAGKVGEYDGQSIGSSGKTAIVLACTRQDYDNLTGQEDTIIIKATPLI